MRASRTVRTPRRMSAWTLSSRGGVRKTRYFGDRESPLVPELLHRGLVVVRPQELNRMLGLEEEPVPVRLLVALRERPLNRFHGSPRFLGERGRKGLRLVARHPGRPATVPDPASYP